MGCETVYLPLVLSIEAAGGNRSAGNREATADVSILHSLGQTRMCRYDKPLYRELTQHNA
jgi:hypothetical protein